jgi:hypothetical protein
MAMPIRNTKKIKKDPMTSTSEAKRERTAQDRSTGKKIGPKAYAQRVMAKRAGKTTKKQELAASRRGGTKSADVKGKGYESKKYTPSVGITVANKKKTTRINMNPKGKK